MVKSIKRRRLALAADLGGTKTNISLFDASSGLREIGFKSYLNKDFSGIKELLDSFLSTNGRPNIKSATLGVAGVVEGNSSIATNLKWKIDGAKVKKIINCRKVEIINDLVATGHAVSLLKKKELKPLQKGLVRKGTKAVIAAGTGLGESILFFDGKAHRPHPTEGGHTDFAPRTDIEAELLSSLQKKYGHVSYERLLSGAGIVDIYEFLKKKRKRKEPARIKADLKKLDPPLVITREALLSKNPLAKETLRLFCSIYGAEAGNLALKSFATGGVYLGGGIAPKIVSLLGNGVFIKAFIDKGRYRKFMKSLPVYVILNEKTALKGSALVALNNLNG